MCDNLGNNTISVRAVNNIGIEVTKTTTTTVVDDKPPNVVDSMVEVLEDGSIGGNVSNDTWDNCHIKSYKLVDGATWDILVLTSICLIMNTYLAITVSLYGFFCSDLTVLRTTLIYIALIFRLRT